MTNSYSVIWTCIASFGHTEMRGSAPTLQDAVWLLEHAAPRGAISGKVKQGQKVLRRSLMPGKRAD